MSAMSTSPKNLTEMKELIKPDEDRKTRFPELGSGSFWYCCDRLKSANQRQLIKRLKRAKAARTLSEKLYRHYGAGRNPLQIRSGFIIYAFNGTLLLEEVAFCNAMTVRTF